MRIKALAASFATATIILSSPANAATIVGAGSYLLTDHGFGGLGAYYGLRLDDQLTSSKVYSVSSGGPPNAPRLILNWNGLGGAGAVATVNGTLALNNNPATPADTPTALATLMYSFTSIQKVGTIGFQAFGGSGQICGAGLSGCVDLVSKNKHNDPNQSAFDFLADGHRIPGDSMTIVGRGWVRESDGKGGFYDTPCCNDFLVRATPVPVPPALLLFGTALGGLGFLARRRRALA